MKKLNKLEVLEKLDKEISRTEARIDRAEKAGKACETDTGRYWGLQKAKSLLLKLKE